MLRTPFLTDLDSRAAIKGSRDPLGIQQVWTKLGRQVVGNLTTVSTSVRDFTVLLLGYHFAARIREEAGDGAEVDTFLKWEQLAAYARYEFNGERGFRGIERVSRNMAERSSVPISGHPSAQIFSNQKVYGIWGQYSTAAKASGLLAVDGSGLTPDAQRIVEASLLPALGKRRIELERKLMRVLKAQRTEIQPRRDTADAPLLEEIAKLLRHPRKPERELYRSHILAGEALGTEVAPRQALLADLLEATLAEESWSLAPKSVRQLERAAEKHRDAGEQLAYHLARIRTAEQVLAPVAVLFITLLGYDGQPLATISNKLKKHWPKGLSEQIDLRALEALTPVLQGDAGDGPTARRWLAMANALAKAEYTDVVRLLATHNAEIVASRGTHAPWIRIEDRKLQVYFRDEAPQALPAGAELRQLWRHPYFLGSMRQIAADLQRAA